MPEAVVCRRDDAAFFFRKARRDPMRMHPVRRLAVISRAPPFGLSLAELTCAGRPHMQGRCAADDHVKLCRLVLCIYNIPTSTVDVMCIECRLRVPVRVGYVRCTYFVNKPLNNDQYHRAHNSHSTRTQHMHKEKMMARRDVSDPSSSSTFRPHGRPSAPLRPMLAAWRPSPLPLAESPLPRQRPPWRLQCA